MPPIHEDCAALGPSSEQLIAIKLTKCIMTGELIANAGRHAVQAFSPSPEYQAEVSLAGKVSSFATHCSADARCSLKIETSLAT